LQRKNWLTHRRLPVQRSNPAALIAGPATAVPHETYSSGRRPFPRPAVRFPWRPKKIPAARNTAEITAFVTPIRKLPWRIASAAFRNHTAAPRYQI
jgi:hypothetical protein